MGGIVTTLEACHILEVRGELVPLLRKIVGGKIVNEQELELFQEVQDSVQRCKPKCGCRCFPQGGRGFIEDSLFIVKHHKIIWAVILFDGAVAFKDVSPEWLEIFAEVIMDSPSIFVEFDRCHKIVEYVAHQDKILPE